MMSLETSIEDREPSYSAVVAIDIGTANSGFMFSLKGFPTNVKQAALEPKEPTILLLTPERQFDSFGQKARERYEKLHEDEAHRWYYFVRFKMELHATKYLSEETWIKAMNEKEMKAKDVFAHALAYFKNEAEKALGRSRLGGIKWVLTVPAIWTQRARQFMRDAAYQARLASGDEPRRIVIALEPEVASLYVRTTSRTRREGLLTYARSRSSLRRSLRSEFPCDSYLIVDCGGGTVDCIAHEQRSNDGYLVEKGLPSGGPWGSTRVDANFELLLDDIFGNDMTREMKLSAPADWNKMMLSFELQKMEAALDDDQQFTAPIPESLQRVHSDFGDGETMEDKLNDYNLNHAGPGKIRLFRRRTLVFTAPIMRKLIDPVVDKIVEHLHVLLKGRELAGVRSLFVVGGFARSAILQDRLKREFSRRVQVVVPKDPIVAVLHGAVLFGHDQQVIAERLSAYTYGVSKLEKLNTDDDGAVAPRFRHNVFDTFVRVNQSVGVNDAVTRRYQTCEPGQLRVTFGVYRSKQEHVEYTTDDGVDTCGQIEIKLKSHREDGHGFVDVTMKFGRTEIEVTAKDYTADSAASGRCKVEFLMI